MNTQSIQPAICEADALWKLYTELARHPDKDFGWVKGKESGCALGYEARWLDSLPDIPWESSSALGNPFSAAPLREDDVVVDLGCDA